MLTAVLSVNRAVWPSRWCRWGSVNGGVGGGMVRAATEAVWSAETAVLFAMKAA